MQGNSTQLKRLFAPWFLEPLSHIKCFDQFAIRKMKNGSQFYTVLPLASLGLSGLTDSGVFKSDPVEQGNVCCEQGPNSAVTQSN